MVDKKTTDQLAELSEILSGEAKLKKDNYSAQRRKTRADSTSKITKYKSKKLNKNTDDDISPKAKNQKSFHNTMKATSKKKKIKSALEQSLKTKKLLVIFMQFLLVRVLRTWQGLLLLLML